MTMLASPQSLFPLGVIKNSYRREKSLPQEFLHQISPAQAMRYPWGMITRDQIRAARGLLDWTQKDLADRANVPLSQIRNIERGVLDPRASTLAAIEAAFDQA